MISNVAHLQLFVHVLSRKLNITFNFSPINPNVKYIYPNHVQSSTTFPLQISLYQTVVNLYITLLVIF